MLCSERDRHAVKLDDRQVDVYGFSRSPPARLSNSIRVNANQVITGGQDEVALSLSATVLCKRRQSLLNKPGGAGWTAPFLRILVLKRRCSISVILMHVQCHVPPPDFRLNVTGVTRCATTVIPYARQSRDRENPMACGSARSVLFGHL